MERGNVSLLKEELIQLFVKSSKVVPWEKPPLLCSVWTSKTYNLDSFCVQMRSIWKTRKKFEIQIIGQNLIVISFEDEDDLESVLEGSPWLFGRKVMLFDRFIELVERKKIRLVVSPYWIRVGPYLPK